MIDGAIPNQTVGPGQAQEPIQTRLARGESVRFKAEGPDNERTIQAEWLAAAALQGNAIDIENAIIEGALKLRSATAKGEVRIVNCEFKARTDFSYATLKRNVDLTNTRFH